MTTTNSTNVKTPATDSTSETGIPDFLDRKKNPEPATQSIAPKTFVEKIVTSAPDLKLVPQTAKDDDTKKALIEEAAAKAKAKAKGRIDKMKAKRNGDLKKMPLQGKAAMALIKSVNVAKPNAKAKVAAKAKPAKAKPAKKDGKTKLQIIGALLKRTNGCTNVEILEASEWPSVSVPAVAKALKLKLKKVKEPGKPTRYYGS